MKRIELSAGVTRIQLAPDEMSDFGEITFSDDHGEYLRQTGFSCGPSPVYRLQPAKQGGAVKSTANGEVVVFDDGEKKFLRMSYSALLRFECASDSVITGLGQHEDGVFNYAAETELLYQHNMKIAVPFILSNDGWGLLIEAGCAMRYRGLGNGFEFELNSVQTVSYVVFRGADAMDVFRKMSHLIGKPMLLPKWAYGYIQSKERYKTADELIEVSREFRERGLGLDCIVLDWMSWNEGCWGDKTPDRSRFPSVKKLSDKLHDMNVRLMVSIWPNCGKGRDCDEFDQAGMFLPGSRIYDAFSPEARELYWQQCKRFWMDGGTDALWCDSCEPITDPDWCGSEKRDPEERMRLLTKASALRMDPEHMSDYGSVHLRGLSEHWRQDYPDKRPVLLSRSGGIDSSSIGAILWSGDVAARWEVLEKQISEGIKASCSGICWWTIDIGAFFVGRKDPWFWRGDYPEGVNDPGYRELYTRWFQFGAMLPVFRSHGTDTPREPWRFGDENSTEYNSIREMIETRYKLLPYLYSIAAQSCSEGLPMMRAMMLAFPEEKALHALHDQYMLGDALLVKPVVRPLAAGGAETEIAMPSGVWYDFFTLTCVEGGKTVKASTPLNRFPLYVRAGSILPITEGIQCAADSAESSLEIWVFEGKDGTFTYYDDAGDGPACREGVYIAVDIHYDDCVGILSFSDAEGGLPIKGEWNLRYIQKDGKQIRTDFHYDGTAKHVVLRNRK